MSLKEKLLDLDIVEDNEYLDEYCDLVESNKETKREKFKTQKHHFIPVCYYKNKYNLKTRKEAEKVADDDKNNFKVNLIYKNHMLAHLLLSLCLKQDILIYDNFIAIQYMMKKVTKDDLNSVQIIYENSRKLASKYNCMYDDITKEKHLKAMRSALVRSKISKTMKEKRERGELFSAETRKKISENQKTLVYVYKENIVIRVKPENLSEYLNNGWTRYVKRSYKQLCGHEMMTVNEIQRNRFNTRGVGCYCILNTGEKFEFKSIRDATVWWFENYHPFGEKYSEVTLQRKIKSSIQGKDITYLPRCSSTRKHVKEDNNVKIITNIKWYK